jgi:hypothetical protein
MKVRRAERYDLAREEKPRRFHPAARVPAFASRPGTGQGASVAIVSSPLSAPTSAASSVKPDMRDGLVGREAR